MKRIITLLAIVLSAGTAFAADPSPERLLAQPAELHLAGARARQQLLVTRLHSGGTAEDLTRVASYESRNPNIATVDKAGIVRPAAGEGAAQQGIAEIVVKHARQQTIVKVHMNHRTQRLPVDFRTDVIGALSKGGCNQGACHGSPQGKNGFQLSLRGYAPDLDIRSLTRDVFGRRINTNHAESSLILLKATAQVAHEGGRRFRSGAPAYQVLRDWISEGGHDSAITQTLSRLEVLPGSRRLASQQPAQQIVVRAHFADGSVRDVTHLCVFTLSDDESAAVDRGGIVTFERTAETAVLVRYRSDISSIRLTYVRHDPEFQFASPPVANDVDKHSFAKHRELQLTPARLASDAVFLRRVYLDTLGMLPGPDEARAFLDSAQPDKRSRLIDHLLARNEFGSFWAMKWADLMRGNREAISERGMHKLHRYLEGMFTRDKPFSDFAREVLTGLGNTIEEPAANFYRVSRTPNEAAESMSQLFLGVRIQCAKCHNHPFEAITQDDYYGFAAYFSRVRLKGIRFGSDNTFVYLDTKGEVKHPTTGKVVLPAAFGQPVANPEAEADVRERLADWVTSPQNRYFARSTVNRIWKHLLGQGIVEPVDDLRDTNPAANDLLLNTMADDFVSGGYHVKPIIRTILNSSTYQLSAEAPVGTSPQAAKPDRYFTRAHIKMLSAEQILDAISSATGVPEPFAGYPLGTRATELAEGAVDHNFLKAFDRPVRDSACECARETEISLNQVLHLLNNPQILGKLKSPQSRLAGWLKKGLSNEAIVELMYLATLSRYPSSDEQQLTLKHVVAAKDRAEGFRDLQYALINANEFLLRH